MLGLATIYRGARASPAATASVPAVSAAPLGEARLAAIGLAAIVVLAVGLRLIPLVFVPSVNWADEIFQTIEPAHRLVYGYGLVPWEFQLGMRSWLLPGLIAGLMKLGAVAGDDPACYLPVIAVCFSLLASAPAICCFLWGRRFFGLACALVGAAAVAIAPELVYFGGRTLVEVVAAHLLVVGCYLLQPGYPVRSPRRLFAAGVLFGLVCLLRIHIAPALLVVLVWSAWGAWRERLPAIVAGGLAALAFGAALDWLTLGYPLASVWRNILYNVLYGVSGEFGVEPWYFYLLGEFGLWSSGALVLLAVLAVGARRLPVLLLAAAAIVAAHSLIGHKEYRFIYPAIVLVMVLAGVGLAQLTSWAAQWLAGRNIRPRAAIAAAAAIVLGYWTLVAFSVWNGDTLGRLRRLDNDHLTAAAVAARLPQMCALGLYGEKGYDWGWYGGYSHLHRPLPMYWPVGERDLTATAPAFNTLLYTRAPPPELGFVTTQCFGQVCVAQRNGGCAAQRMAAMPFPDALAALRPTCEKFEAVPHLPSSPTN